MSSTTHLCYTRVLQSKTASSMADYICWERQSPGNYPKVGVGVVNGLLSEMVFRVMLNFCLFPEMFENTRNFDIDRNCVFAGTYMELCIYWHHSLNLKSICEWLLLSVGITL